MLRNAFLIIFCVQVLCPGLAAARVKVSPDDNVLHWDSAVGYYGNGNVPATAHVWSGSEWQPAAKYRYLQPADETASAVWRKGNEAWTEKHFLEYIYILLLNDTYPARPVFKNIEIQGDAQPCGDTIICNDTVVHDVMVNHLTGQGSVSLSCSDQPSAWAGVQNFQLGLLGRAGSATFLLANTIGIIDPPVGVSFAYTVTADLAHSLGKMICSVEVKRY